MLIYNGWRYRSSYNVLRTVRANLTNPFGGDAPASAFTWNNLKPSDLTTDQSYLSGNLVTETNAVTGIQITNRGSWQGATRSLFPVDGTPSNGVYPYEIVGSAWQYKRDDGNILEYLGLDDTKYYTVFVGITDCVNDGRTASATISGETKSKATYNTYGVSGENEFTSNYYFEFKNKQSASGVLDITFNEVGFFIGLVGAVIIQESTMLKP